SPAEYTPQVVAGKTVILTTTNGTKALLECRRARQILLGAFVNLSALARVLEDRTHVDLVCAGTDGHITREDVLLAGALCAAADSDGAWQLDDQAELALDVWRQLATDARANELKPRLIEALRESRGGRNLVELGMDHDLALAAEVDRFAIVP